MVAPKKCKLHDDAQSDIQHKSIAATRVSPQESSLSGSGRFNFFFSSPRSGNVLFGSRQDMQQDAKVTGDRGNYFNCLERSIAAQFGLEKSESPTAKATVVMPCNFWSLPHGAHTKSAASRVTSTISIPKSVHDKMFDKLFVKRTKPTCMV